MQRMSSGPWKHPEGQQGGWGCRQLRQDCQPWWKRDGEGVVSMKDSNSGTTTAVKAQRRRQRQATRGRKRAFPQPLPHRRVWKTTQLNPCVLHHAKCPLPTRPSFPLTMVRKVALSPDSCACSAKDTSPPSSPLATTTGRKEWGGNKGVGMLGRRSTYGKGVATRTSKQTHIRGGRKQQGYGWAATLSM